MTLSLQIDGAAITDITSFYTEINRVFMAGESWQLGASLDALDDLLYGGYGVLHGHATATVVWQDINHSRTALGRDTTRAWLLAKLEQPAAFNGAVLARQLAALDHGEGRTYFEIVLEIFAAHPNITLVTA